MAAASTLAYPDIGNMPTELPVVPFFTSTLPGRYGMLKGDSTALLPNDCPLKMEVLDLEKWLCGDMVLTRAFPAVRAVTWRNYTSTISLYAGFLHHGARIPLNEISLRAFTHPTHVLQYLAFKLAKAKAVQGVRSEISVAKRILLWLNTVDGRASQAKHDHNLKLTALLDNLMHQVQAMYPMGVKPIDAPPPPPPPPLPTQLQVLHVQTEMKARAVAVIYQATKIENRPLTPKEACLLLDWCLLEWLCSNIPTLRLMCLRSMQAPHSVEHGHECGEPNNCRFQHCKGNRLEVDASSTYSYLQDRISMQPPSYNTGE